MNEASLSTSRRVIKATSGWAPVRVRELWEYRELLYFLTWRDVKVRYKQAVLGVAWVVMQPLMAIIVFGVVFNRVLGVESGDPDIPYPVMTFAGLLPWQLFAGALQRGGISLVGNANLLTKVYFPRLVIPISAVLAGIVDFGISLVVFLIMMGAYGIAPSWQIVFLPFLVLLAMATALAFGLWLSALNVMYRDVQYIIPYLIQLWLFLSPVAYPATAVTGPWRYVFGLNPMAGVVQGFRWCLYGDRAPDVLLFVAGVIVLLVLVSGLFYFRRMERVFADVV
jgi:lipopolysaccharide transport system permease protein